MTNKFDEMPSCLEAVTFQNPAYNLNELARFNEPKSFNGEVYVRKWKVTAERIEEPVEVIHARIQNLWDLCDNSHQWCPLKECAAKYGYELNGTPGSKRKAKIGRRML